MFKFYVRDRLLRSALTLYISTCPHLDGSSNKQKEILIAGKPRFEIDIIDHNKH